MKKENNFVPQKSNPLADVKIPENFIFHEDAGHGWLQVPVALLIGLRIDQQITGYSYRKADQAYLEEDLDMITFLKAFFNFRKTHLQKSSYDVFFSQMVESKITDHSEVRNFPHYY